MKVRMFGFDIEAGASAISVKKFMNHLSTVSGAPKKIGEIERRIFIDDAFNKNYYLGLVVTVKDQKRFCKLENSKGQIKITVENLTGDDKLMDFNFFVINKSNGIGLYQHYHQSCGLNVFGGQLVSCYKEFRESELNSEIERENKNNGGISTKKEQEIKKKYRGGLRFAQLVRKESLEKILKEYKELKAFEFEISALDANVRNGIPLLGYAKKLREKLTFQKGWGVSVLASEIAKAVNQINPKSGRVHAVNMFDEDVSLRIFNMPDNFGEEDFDDVALKLHNLDLNSFSKHKVSKEMVKICGSDDYQHIFEADLK
ncbi:hypothetical protein [uncultured Oxalicibacterium sp.]|uniref:hypothetical protein n=1 Tax=uncultured Oxalicibacterium sp. TaxID=1168540 RepID=UPI0025F2BD3C|nr:hypothetical protein [uncultured Oxalicibacterium sp.]